MFIPLFADLIIAAYMHYILSETLHAPSDNILSSTNVYRQVERLNLSATWVVYELLILMCKHLYSGTKAEGKTACKLARNFVSFVVATERNRYFHDCMTYQISFWLNI